MIFKKRSENEVNLTDLLARIDALKIRIESLERRVDLLAMDFESVVRNARDAIISLEGRIKRMKRKMREDEDEALGDILFKKIKQRIYGLGIAQKTEEE